MWNDVIMEFALPGGLTITRTGEGTMSDGFYTDGSESILTVNPVSVQPASGKDLELLPEGARTNATVKVYCTTRLRTASTPGGGKPDTFLYDGSTWEVKTEQPWQTGRSDVVYKHLAQKVAG